MCFHRLSWVDQPLHSQRAVLHCLSIPWNFIHNKLPQVRHEQLLTSGIILVLEYRIQNCYAFRQWADKGNQATQRAKEGAWTNKARTFKKGRELLAFNRHQRNQGLMPSTITNVHFSTIMKCSRTVILTLSLSFCLASVHRQIANILQIILWYIHNSLIPKFIVLSKMKRHPGPNAAKHPIWSHEKIELLWGGDFIWICAQRCVTKH